jgi:ABC-2 type transport system permease protein
MNAWSIARKDLMILWRDRGALAAMFVLPLAFILVLGVATAPMYAPPSDSRTRLPVVNLDGGEAGQRLLDVLDQQNGIEVVLTSEDQAMAWMHDRTEGRLLIIPANMTSDLAARNKIVLRFLVHPDWAGERTDALQRTIDGAALGITMETQLLDSLSQMGKMELLNPPEERAFTPDVIVAQAQSQMERSKTDPLISVVQVKPASLVASDNPSALEQNVPGYAVLFVFLTAQVTAESIYREKVDGTFRRLLAAPVARLSVLIGKLIPNLIMAVLQMCVLLAVGTLVLPALGLGEMGLGHDPLALILLVMVVALCSTSFGILIAALAHTDGQIGGLSSLLLWSMGALGGCLFPSFLLGGALDAIGRVVPHHWAVNAFLDLLARGRGLADIRTSLLVLCGFSVAFFAIGLWRFDFD